MAGDRRTPGRPNTGGEVSYLSASHTPLPLCLRCPQGPVLRDGLGSSSRKSLLRREWRHEEVSFLSSALSPWGFFPPFGHAGARLRYQRLLTLRRPFYRLLRHRSVRVVGTCCTRLLRQGHLCQVGGARTAVPSDSAREQLADFPGMSGRNKKQRVVKVVTDAWLATAGLRGGQILEAWFSTSAASHTPLLSASAAPQGSELRDGLGSSVVSPCYAVSGGMEKCLRIFFSLRGVSFHPLVTQGRDCDINAFLTQGRGCVINAPRRCGVPSTGCCGTGPSGLSGPVALGPGIRALVSGQSSSPLYLPGQCA